MYSKCNTFRNQSGFLRILLIIFIRIIKAAHIPKSAKTYLNIYYFIKDSKPTEKKIHVPYFDAVITPLDLFPIYSPIILCYIVLLYQYLSYDNYYVFNFSN